MNQDQGKQLNTYNTMQKEDGSIQGRYVDYAVKHDWLPPDDVLNDIWGIGNGTLTSIRSRMKKVGFEFAKDRGGWSVVKRPAEKPIRLPSHRPTEPTEPTEPTNITDDQLPLTNQPEPPEMASIHSPGLSEQLGTIIARLDMLISIWSK